jgi:hypothetical protein
MKDIACVYIICSCFLGIAGRENCLVVFFFFGTILAFMFVMEESEKE